MREHVCWTRDHARKIVEKPRPLHLWYVLLALIAVVWVRDLWVASTAIQTVAYSDFQQYLRD